MKKCDKKVFESIKIKVKFQRKLKKGFQGEIRKF